MKASTSYYARRDGFGVVELVRAAPQLKRYGTLRQPLTGRRAEFCRQRPAECRKAVIMNEADPMRIVEVGAGAKLKAALEKELWVWLLRTSG